MINSNIPGRWVHATSYFSYQCIRNLSYCWRLQLSQR